MNQMTYRLNFPIQQEDILGLREKLSRQLYEAKVSGKSTYALVNVIDEICCNLMEYSQANWMEVEVEPQESAVKAVLRDDGVEFDPTAAINNMDPSQPATVTERRLGLYMVGLMTKDLSYKREGKVNQLVFSMATN